MNQKNYYIRYRNGCSDVFELYHVEAGSEAEQRMIEAGYKRISRKEAIARCILERQRRKHGAPAEGCSSTRIMPWGYGVDDSMDDYHTIDGYIYERIE